ncbi:MAG: serine/threonine-protein phosphatase [Euryarchaeota archaeon]|nr:serine/threonine-protein phosphatase [Euryarchaeota archaeon]MBV1730114.1 serine/threonine-protein phosphatase [Methanobacterium sp.]MBU4548258.1 serine/threonine-protein phosphatase [Euryarchaeota archaeon]MBU4607681.1 serine/threonine-protein phosphatase [Euryarchaeota archaeon]MBV1755815.1 serine/threonine-protein phosphatase [Methanobacterium sp.]
MTYHEKELTLKTGDRIYLYTDGITEAINPQDELFGDSYLQAIMNNTHNLSLSDIVFYVKQKLIAL